MLAAKIPTRSFIAAAMGTMVEYYDYALFTLFLPITAPLFFPADSAYHSLVKGFYVLLIAMIFRPFGALIFGYIGDVYGRRIALKISMYGIAFATILISLTPSYATLGLLSTVIVLTAKAIQTFCFGGEYNGAGIYVVEHAQNKNEAFVGSLLSATTLAGSFIASLIGIIITLPTMPAESWRMTFFLGGLIGIVGIISRKNLKEIPHFQQANDRRDNLITLIKNFRLELLCGVFIGGFSTIPFTTVLIFVMPVLMTKGLLSSQQFMVIQSLLILLAIVTLLVAGKAADRKSPAKVMHLGSLALVFLSFPLCLLLDKANKLWLLISSAGFIIINEILFGPSNAFLKNLFPMQFRYRGASLSFTVGMSILGGLTPLVENYLYQTTGSMKAIAFWLALIGGCTYIMIQRVTNQQAKLDTYKPLPSATEQEKVTKER